MKQQQRVLSKREGERRRFWKRLFHNIYRYHESHHEAMFPPLALLLLLLLLHHHPLYFLLLFFLSIYLPVVCFKRKGMSIYILRIKQQPVKRTKDRNMNEKTRILCWWWWRKRIIGWSSLFRTETNDVLQQRVITLFFFFSIHLWLQEIYLLQTLLILMTHCNV